jgi:hypothetical protein
MVLTHWKQALTNRRKISGTGEGQVLKNRRKISGINEGRCS